MKIIDSIILILLIATLIFSLYVLNLYLPFLPGSEEKFYKFSANFSDQISGNIQFYPNMRYKDRTISYSIENACPDSKKTDVARAFNIISGKTILEFYQSENGEIQIYCSELAPRPEERNHFIAGEGGPSKTINTTLFSVILLGKISLYRNEKCSTPNIAVHEILHSLGFDHNNNKDSILYPITSCDQQIDQYIIDEINKLYAYDSLPDLAIASADASKTGRMLDFEVHIYNIGLANATAPKLEVYANDKLAKEVELDNFDIGTRIRITITNIILPASANKITFYINAREEELSKENNRAEVSF